MHSKSVSIAMKSNFASDKSDTLTESIAEQAFARTDSKNNKNNKLSNNYSSQLDELNKPIDNTQTKPVFKDLYQPELKQITTAQNTHITPQATFVDAKILSSYDPKYPSMAKRKGIELEVTVHFTIDKNGFVSNVEIDQQSKVNYFRRTIMSAMEKWRFVPAQKNGSPVESQMTKIFSFSLVS